MSKFFEVIGYVASVLAAAFGIIYLINLLTGREIDEELDLDECECAEAECADAETAEVAE